VGSWRPAAQRSATGTRRWRDPIAGTPWHTPVPARIEPLVER
jgi:hypothetical protein